MFILYLSCIMLNKSVNLLEHTLLYISKNLNRYLTLLLGLLKTIVITLNRSKILRYNYRQVTILNQKKWYYITSRNSRSTPQHWILLKCYLETIYISIVTYLPSLISFYMCTGDFFPLSSLDVPIYTNSIKVYQRIFQIWLKVW